MRYSYRCHTLTNLKLTWFTVVADIFIETLGTKKSALLINSYINQHGLTDFKGRTLL